MCVLASRIWRDIRVREKKKIACGARAAERQWLLAVPGAKAGKEAGDEMEEIPAHHHAFRDPTGGLRPTLHLLSLSPATAVRSRPPSLQNKLKRTLRKTTAQHKKRGKGSFALCFYFVLFILFIYLQDNSTRIHGLASGGELCPS